MKIFEQNLENLKTTEEITQVKRQPIGITINGWFIIESSTIFKVFLN